MHIFNNFSIGVSLTPFFWQNVFTGSVQYLVFRYATAYLRYCKRTESICYQKAQPCYGKLIVAAPGC